MPTWSGISKEIQELSNAGNPSALDIVRRNYLTALYQHTGRSTILYATKCTQPDPNVPSYMLGILDEDLQGIMEVIYQLPGPNLDLILHSPGGALEAAEALVLYLRSKFEHMRVLVPQLAMSAATMIACAADEIVLGKHSFLGPIDPQVMVRTELGQRMVAAQDILDQFDLAKEECQDPAKMGAWLPMLSQYGPDLLIQCKNFQDLSSNLVQDWLERYMFKGDADRNVKASKIAEWLSDHSHFKTHGRHIPREELQAKGLNVTCLEDDRVMQDLLLSVFHATTLTFDRSPAVKLIESHMGKAFIKQLMIVPVSGAHGKNPPQLLVPSSPKKLANKPKLATQHKSVGKGKRTQGRNARRK